MAVLSEEHPPTRRPVSLKREIGLIGLLWASTGSIIGSGWLFGAQKALVTAGPAAIISWVIGGEAVGRGEVARMQAARDRDDEDRRQRDADLPPGGGAVGVGQHLHAQEVHRDEDRHQDDRDDEPADGEGSVGMLERLGP